MEKEKKRKEKIPRNHIRMTNDNYLFQITLHHNSINVNDTEKSGDKTRVPSFFTVGDIVRECIFNITALRRRQ